MKLEHFATKKDGKFTITQRKTFEEGLSLLPDGNYTVIVEKRKKKRSNPFNNYYWGCVVEPCAHFLRENWGDVIETELGPVPVDSTYAHEWLLRRFNSVTVINEHGEEERFTLRTSKGEGNESDAFYKYVDRCKKGIFLEWNYTCAEQGDQLEIDS